MRVGRWVEGVRTEPELLMATLQTKKANNLEILEQSLRLEIDSPTELLIQLCGFYK